MEALIKTRKIGGSLVITIPRVIVEEEGLMPNQIVEINVKKIKKSGFGIAKGIGPFLKEDKFEEQLEKNEQVRD